jgi:preprotein translocase subunit SecE
VAKKDTIKKDDKIQEKSETAEGGNKFQLKEFFDDTKDELSKVVWPSRQQLLSESAAVMLMVTLVATVIYLVDNFFTWASGKVF